MINLTEKEFEEKKKLNIIFPVFIEINGDEMTPVNIFYKLRGKYKFLLESASTMGEVGRYSFMGSNPYKFIKSTNDNVTIVTGEEVVETKGNILDFAQEYLIKNYEDCCLELPFVGGAIGYVGYDVIRQYEQIPNNNYDELKLPEAFLLFYKDFICYDHLKHNLIIVHNVLPEYNEDYSLVLDILYKTKALLKEEAYSHQLVEVSNIGEIKSNYEKEEFCQLVNKAKEYIKAGDVFQVVLSQRLRIKNFTKPFEVYRRLRRSNPSPYMFYIDFETFQLSGASPESLVKVQNNKVYTNPIAGTRPRGENAKEDEKLKKELLMDEKEVAEHLMLVDLGRNDIGRISSFGSVKLDRFMEIDMFSHVMHIASKVSGELLPELNCFDALASCLPVGTVSGAPKIRAMEIIDELENTKRGIYSGAVGYFSYEGSMDTCIAIRTIVFKDEFAYVQAGAGIVYDSVPEKEYEETLNKSMALREVL